MGSRAPASADLEAFSLTAALVSSTASPEAALCAVTQRARGILDTTVAIGSVVLADSPPLITFSGSGLPGPLDPARLAALAATVEAPIRLTPSELKRGDRWRDVRDLVVENLCARGWLAAPIIDRHGAVLGLLQAFSDRGGRFTAADERRLFHLALLVAVAFERFRASAEAERRRRESDVIAAVVATINASLDLDAILLRVAVAAKELCCSDDSGMATRDAATGVMNFRYWPTRPDLEGTTFLVEPGKGHGGIVLSTGRPARTADYSNDPRISKDYAGWIRQHRVAAQIVVPIHNQGQIDGLIYAFNHAPRPFTDHDEALLVRLADHAAVALRNAQLFAAEQSARAAAETSERRVRELVQTLDAVVWEADADSGRFTFVSDRAETLLGYPVDRWLGEPDFWAERIHPEDRESVVAQRRAAISAGADYSLTYRLQATDGRAIWVRDHVHLVLGPGGRAEQLRGVMVDVSSPVAIRKALEARTRQQSAVAELGQRALSGHDVASLLDDAVTTVANALSVEYAAVLELLPDETSCLLTAGVGWEAGMVGHTVLPATHESQAGYTLTSHGPVIVDDLRNETRFRSSELLREHGVTSGISVIIPGTARTFGVLGAHTRHRRQFTDDDIKFMEAVANVIGLGVARAFSALALEQRNERMNILRQIDAGILTARSVREIVGIALERIRRLAPYDRAGVFLFSDDGGEATVLAEGDMMKDILDIYAAMPERDVLRVEGGRATIDVPLLFQGEPIGLLRLSSETPGAFLPEHLEIAREVAQSLAVAIEQARLDERIWTGRERLTILSRRLVEVQESERRHLSRELHDEIGQILTGLRFTLEGARGCPDPTLRLDLETAREIVTELMERVRNLSLDLRPPMLDDLGLVPTLLWHFDRYKREAKIDVDFRQRDVEGRRFPSDIETTAYRIVQEALTNVARHAGTNSVTVRVWEHDGMLSVQIEDHGVGFDSQAAKIQDHGGLTGMRERAILLGGRFEIESCPGRGACITGELPLDGSIERRAVPR
jgi:PAS domain S-box-containing protein